MTCSTETKLCHMCGEEIKAIAKKCKHCGEMIQDAIIAHQSKPDFKNCPQCAEQVKADATVCEHCHSQLKQNASVWFQEQKVQNKNIWILTGAFVGLALCLPLISSTDLSKTLWGKILGISILFITAWIISGKKDYQSIKQKYGKAPHWAWLFLPPVYVYQRQQICGRSKDIFVINLSVFSLALVISLLLTGAKSKMDQIREDAEEQINYQIVTTPEIIEAGIWHAKITKLVKIADNRYLATVKFSNGETNQLNIRDNNGNVFIEWE